MEEPRTKELGASSSQQENGGVWIGLVATGGIRDSLSGEDKRKFWSERRNNGEVEGGDGAPP